MPVLHAPVSLNEFWQSPLLLSKQKFIAHCVEDENKTQLAKVFCERPSVMLIGPEGDFTEQEISIALQHDFTPVALGQTRLRTETAGIVAATLLQNI